MSAVLKQLPSQVQQKAHDLSREQGDKYAKKPMETANKRDDTWSNLVRDVGVNRSEKAFAQLFEHFGPLLKGFLQANGAGLSADIIDELVQEVMVKVWLKSQSFDPSKAAASTWIYTIARNARIDYLRKHQNLDAQTQPLETSDIWDEESDQQPFVYLYQSRNEKHVGQLLGELSGEQRQCIKKVYMEGKSHTEIATELELPLGTVKSRIRLGLKRLQSLITPTATTE